MEEKVGAGWAADNGQTRHAVSALVFVVAWWTVRWREKHAHVFRRNHPRIGTDDLNGVIVLFTTHARTPVRVDRGTAIASCDGVVRVIVLMAVRSDRLSTGNRRIGFVQSGRHVLRLPCSGAGQSDALLGQLSVSDVVTNEIVTIRLLSGLLLALLLEAG